MTIINMSGGRAGKTPVYQARTVTPAQFPQTVQPQTGYDALSQVTVNAPANLLAQNIRKDVNIAGVTGTYEAIAPTISLQQKTVTPSATQQTVTPDPDYNGLSQVTVDGDSNLKASNIKSGVSIFGVTGTYEGNPLFSGTGVYEAEYADSGPSYPMIRVGRPITSFPRTGLGSFSSFVQTVGNSIGMTYKEHVYFSANGAQKFHSRLVEQLMVQAVGYSQNTFSRLDMSDYSWTNTNRDSSTMDGFLQDVSTWVKEDYFSGTLVCFPCWVVYLSSGWYTAVELYSAPSSQGGTVNVPFTYSNGNVTYTLGSAQLDKLYDGVVSWETDSEAQKPTKVQPALMFSRLVLFV